MDDLESLAALGTELAPGQAGTGDGTHLRAPVWAGERQLRAAVLAVAVSESRLRTEELRARHARVVRKLTAAEEGTAALTGHLAALLPHHAERLRALSTDAKKAAGEWRRAAGEEHHGSVTAAGPGAAGPVRAGAQTVAAMRRRSEALAQRLEQARADVRATIAQIQQGRPRREILKQSEMARMRAKLDTMPVIEQAKGIIVAQAHCRPDEAFDLLRRASQRANVPVRDLAAQIVAKTAAGRAHPGGGGKKASASPAPHGAPARRARSRAAALGAEDRPGHGPSASSPRQA